MVNVLGLGLGVIGTAVLLYWGTIVYYLAQLRRHDP